ncbi:hypothetical protein [Saccharothrix longispora]|uniref:hypothetical protein n=1 Tax=Saccharothrix longispora TaxID=33920 RepID=UPI0028FD5B23|nr:hypothetical protein [Saccharothrix longispora]MDU0292764.1 hypothetical protein [Saccharothrix longispora]
MSVVKDLISASARNLVTGSIVAAINSAFQDEGFAPDPGCHYDNSSVRRTTVRKYLTSVDR